MRLAVAPPKAVASLTAAHNARATESAPYRPLTTPPPVALPPPFPPAIAYWLTVSTVAHAQELEEDLADGVDAVVNPEDNTALETLQEDVKDLEEALPVISTAAEAEGEEALAAAEKVAEAAVEVLEETVETVIEEFETAKEEVAAAAAAAVEEEGEAEAAE